ncbi:hypothetical protein BS50DRAFT_75696 [Corynespora cassiicola Philippines]|uniref:Uncharacterized protein n=1 Tax=Corynespora cassiicola Philippines TaxID=1448308 RepID=A0A2T2NGD8_CORCC|nr:hypothetical protein BS50DRAFT_75696 [Corynespora cassiicola Philippines]
MDLIQSLITQYEALMLYIAAAVSRVEVEMLHIPPSLRFFTVGAGPNELVLQAFSFVIAPLYAFIMIPLARLAMRRYFPQHRSYRIGVLPCLKDYAFLFSVVWFPIFLAREFHVIGRS